MRGVRGLRNKAGADAAARVRLGNAVRLARSRFAAGLCFF